MLCVRLCYTQVLSLQSDTRMSPYRGGPWVLFMGDTFIPSTVLKKAQVFVHRLQFHTPWQNAMSAYIFGVFVEWTALVCPSMSMVLRNVNCVQQSLGKTSCWTKVTPGCTALSLFKVGVGENPMQLHLFRLCVQLCVLTAGDDSCIWASLSSLFSENIN